MVYLVQEIPKVIMLGEKTDKGACTATVPIPIPTLGSTGMGKEGIRQGKPDAFCNVMHVKGVTNEEGDSDGACEAKLHFKRATNRAPGQVMKHNEILACMAVWIR